MLNLVRNSFEVMASAGVVVIKTCQEGHAVVLMVQDTGCGIPPHIQERMGHPFITTKDNGTGLGLSVCYRIAQRNSAKLEYQTSEEGTTFYLRFF